MESTRLLCISYICVTAACQIPRHGTQSPQPREPDQPTSILTTPVDFSGSEGPTLDPRSLEEIRIGLFAPPDQRHRVGGPMQRAATLAIEQINAAGGHDGTPLTTVTRWDDDPWSGGSKQMIKLVYEDSVWAVIGSVDGATTHIAEQVVTKAWVPLLSPVSADPTLTYIRIPWMFRLPPNDREQALTIVRHGIMSLSTRAVGMITSTDHDGRIFAGEMLGAMEEYGVATSFHLEVSADTADNETIARRAVSFSTDAIIVRLPPTRMLALLDQIRRVGFEGTLLIPWIPGLEPAEIRGHYDGTLMVVEPHSTSEDPAYQAFANTYSARYGEAPTPAAAYTYDAIRMLAEALRESGLNRARLRDALTTRTGFLGVTGPISWDNAGGNVASPGLLVMQKPPRQQ